MNVETIDAHAQETTLSPPTSLRRRPNTPALAAALTLVALAAPLSAACIGEDPAPYDGAPAESTLAACTDGLDNDGDRLVDCADPDCQVFIACAPTTDPTSDADVTSPSPDTAVANPVGCVDHDECDPDRGVLCVDGACVEASDLTPGPAPALYGAMGMLEGPNTEPNTVGAIIGTFCGVPAYQNGPDPSYFAGYGDFGPRHQSTELAYRFLCDHYALCDARTVPYGEASAWYDNTTDPVLGPLERHASGGAEPPRPGDVLVFDVGTYGHVAVVREVLIGDGVGVVHVLEQNVYGGSHAYTLEVDAGAYRVPGARGWLRVPDAPAACGATGRFVSVAVNGDRLDLQLEASSPPGIFEIEVYLDETAIIYRSVHPDKPTSLDPAPQIDLAALEVAHGFHTLTLHVGKGRAVATTSFVYVGDEPHPYHALFQEAAAEFGVPACLLAAIAHARSGWNQSARSPAGEHGVMHLGGARLIAAAGLLGVSQDALRQDSLAGADQNIRAAAALLAHVATGADGSMPVALPPGAPWRALESWWPVVAWFGAINVAETAPADASNFAYRVYHRLATGVPDLISPVPIDLTAFPPVQGSRPATPQELADGVATPDDQLLPPATPPLHVRTFAPFDPTALATRHDCDGPCADAACSAAECPLEAQTTCVGGELLWLDGCGQPHDIADACVDENPCTLDGCSVGMCIHTALPSGTSCGNGKICVSGQCQCKPQATRACVDGDVRWVDGCGTPGALADACDDPNPCVVSGCEDGLCVYAAAPPETTCGPAGELCAGSTCGCAAEASAACAGGAVYWFDSCGNPGAVKEDCNDGDPCTADACLDGACHHTALPDGTLCGAGNVCTDGQCACEPDAGLACAGGRLHRYDSCGNQGPIADDCGDANPCTLDGCADGACTHEPLADGTPCGAGRQCVAGACLCAPDVAQVCVAGQLYWQDSCGVAGDLADACDDGDPCTLDGCVADACAHTPADDGLQCGEGLTCQDGACATPCVDNDGDGFYANCEPYDCEGHDNDAFIHPGAPELWDIRDNDCDGVHDAFGRIRYHRYFKAWSTSDWEHRYSLEPIAGWEADGHWFELYPPDVCDGPYAPVDGCLPKNNSSEIELWGGAFILVALSQCEGVFASGAHISLLLPEDGGEFSVDYSNFPNFTCTRLGYFLGPAAATPMPHAKMVYRHRSDFSGPNAVGDNMWSVVPDEGEPWYQTHEPHFWVLDGGSTPP